MVVEDAPDLPGMGRRVEVIGPGLSGDRRRLQRTGFELLDHGGRCRGVEVLYGATVARAVSQLPQAEGAAPALADPYEHHPPHGF